MIFFIIEKNSSIPASGGDMYTKKSARIYLTERNVDVDVNNKTIILKRESHVSILAWDAIAFLVNKKSYQLRDKR